MKISRCALIKADPHDVWEVIADIENEKNWNPVMREEKITSDKKSGIGCERSCEYEGGWQVKEMVVEYEHGRKLCETAYEGMPFDSNKTCFTLRPVSGGTDVTWDFEYDGAAMALNEAKFKKYAAKGMEKALLGLRDRVLSRIPAE